MEPLIQTHPRLAKQWSARNGALTPGMVSAGSHKRIWWICEQGHELRASVHSRIGKNAGCPVCAGRVKSHHYAADAVWPVQTVKSRETVFENKTY